MKNLNKLCSFLLIGITILLPAIATANWDDITDFQYRGYLNGPIFLSLDICGVCTEDGTPDPSICDVTLTLPPSGNVNGLQYADIQLPTRVDNPATTPTSTWN
jgi:hypothetical protein